VGFGASFGGKWFGGYGVSPRDGELWKQSHRTVTRQGAAFRRYGVFFDRADYSILRPPAGSVVYCDPPYAGTTSYATGPFDHEGFYKVLRGWAADCFVYVSEYSIPSTVDHEVVWQRERRTSLKSDVNVEVRMEKLFRVAP
jgi:DNA adenine methylase